MKLSITTYNRKNGNKDEFVVEDAEFNILIDTIYIHDKINQVVHHYQDANIFMDNYGSDINQIQMHIHYTYSKTLPE